MKKVYLISLGSLFVTLLAGLLIAGTSDARAVDATPAKATSVSNPGAESEDAADASGDSDEVMPPDEDGDAQADSDAEKTPVSDIRWTAPDFSHQEKALGWTPKAFDVPRGMEDRVQFWKDIYTKYTTDQGVLHDSKYVQLVYETVDFGDITKHADWTPRQKAKARYHRVKDAKKTIADRLKRLQQVKNPAALIGEDKRYWDLFAKVDEPKKFLEAAKRGRLRFQLGQRDMIEKGIYQSGLYLRQMEEVFRQEGLPIELTRLPFVESSFNLHARSRVGASGIWQFMRSTARHYMRMDRSCDERNDPLRATHAAARKLRENFEMLKSWPLAVTAYNRGPAGVLRLTKKIGSNDIVDLIDVRKGRFKFASANFYASFLAVLNVESHAEKYFGSLEILPELRSAEIRLSKSLSAQDILKYFDGDLELAKKMNPAVSSRVWQGRLKLSYHHYLHIPLNEQAQK
jgi:membrane-bound lytic murein transglycosylase D